jgi:hypothetical protein
LIRNAFQSMFLESFFLSSYFFVNLLYDIPQFLSHLIFILIIPLFFILKFFYESWYHCNEANLKPFSLEKY